MKCQVLEISELYEIIAKQAQEIISLRESVDRAWSAVVKVRDKQYVHDMQADALRSEMSERTRTEAGLHM